ncbi:hypothetical protein KZZ52_28195 [Dactylosporangium sp. AC04546]|uniref:hypothetical protein n=1 Tax=Dactylosporangium sp. AC04546 TaxID=2862460 RepID=UPI001EE11415|nr:hypothetical protein [Dactylosporangium sp. AC04546]WVK89150.1 hypothetical protein KZZ52_28195 [Dactylosporangium sp. AC04546]
MRPKADGCAMLAVGALLMLAHPVAPLLREPYWLDESWVVLATKARLADLPLVTSSTPLGWTFLVWLLPPAGQVQRLVPWLFLAVSAVAAYGVARLLGWTRRTTAVTAGLGAAAAVLLLPAQQQRHDLKQYTADAAVGLLLVLLLAWAERSWSPRRLAAAGAATVLGMLFSHAAALVGAAVLAAMLGAALWSRQRARQLHAVAVTGLAGLGMAAVYLTVDRANRNESLVGYWDGYFPAVADLPQYLRLRLDELQPALGVPWPILVLLAGAGVATVAWRRRPATAAALALLPVIAVAAGVTRSYPLLDLRTSHFLLVLWVATAAIGLVGAADLLAGLLEGRLRRPWAAAVAAAVVAVAVAGYAVANRTEVWQQSRVNAADEDVRAQVRYVAGHRGPGDVVLVNMSGQYGFAYYWPANRPQFVRGGVQATGWYVRYRPEDRIIVAADRDHRGIVGALDEARRLAGPGGRVWLVRSHVQPAEAALWHEALAGWHADVVTVGPEPVALLVPPSP